MLKLKRKIEPDVERVFAQPSAEERVAAIFQQIAKEAMQLEDKVLRDLWMDGIGAFIQSGNLKELEKITRWRRPVVPLDEFLFGEAYLGVNREELYPGIYDALQKLDTDQFDEVVAKGALGIGKTTLANLGMARDLYKLSCMRSPQQTYGIAAKTPIVFTIQSVRLSTARKVVFSEFGRLVRESPYFKTHSPYNPLITSEMIFPKQNIHIVPLSSAGNAVISMNVLGGQMDEVNFLQKILKSKSSQADQEGTFDQAKQLYNTLATRRKSRFLHRGDLPGALYIISSSRFPDDFTEVRAKKSEMYGGNDPRIFVFEGSQWSIKGRENFMKEEFRVQLGNTTFPSKVLKDGEPPNIGCETISVPMDFYDEFMRDCDGAIRDVAGLTTLATRPFITQRQKIQEANNLAKEHGYVNPLDLEQCDFTIGFPDLDRNRLRTDVIADRAAHIDLGISKDACGIAVGHIAGHKVNEYRSEDGKVETEVLPVIAYDVILRVVPPLGGEIQLEDIRKFLKRLNTKYRLGLKYVTFDGFNSVDSRQLLAKQGFQTGYQSVEKAEPWRTFRDALYDGRVLLPGHNFLNKELAEVETTMKNNKEKIDHRPNGTKDVADAVVGVAAFWLSRRIAWQNARFDGGRTGLFLLGSRKTDNVIGDGKPNRPLMPNDNKLGRKSIIRRNIPRRNMVRR
jgi:hypothetical protein